MEGLFLVEAAAWAAWAAWEQAAEAAEAPGWGWEARAAAATWAAWAAWAPGGCTADARQLGGSRTNCFELPEVWRGM